MLELYLDESGNTGTNYMDDNQPYFVYGGWLIESEKATEICEGINSIFCYSRAKELKAINKFSYEKYRELFFMMIHDFNAIPVFGVADKKYMVAAKVVETFFDHMYNPNVNGYLTFRSELKKALADSIYANKELLAEFSGIIRNGTIKLEEMRKIAEMLSDHFKKENLFDVQQSVSGLSDFSLQEMIGEFESVSKNGTEKRWLTLVEPILIERLIYVDSYSELRGEKVSLYVDELWGYQNVFEEVKDILNRGRLIKNVKFIKQCKSDSNLLIQAADLLCGFIGKTLINKQVIMKNEAVNEIWYKFFSMNHDLQIGEVGVWNYYAHSDFIYEIKSLTGNTITKRGADCNKIIERDFLSALRES